MTRPMTIAPLGALLFGALLFAPIAHAEQESAAPAETETSTGEDKASADEEEIEFVGGAPTEAGAPESEAMPLPAAPEVDDKTPPLIEDLAVAAANPETPPMITAVLTDDWSGVERAEVYFRPKGEGEFRKVTLSAGAGGLFIGRLPDGVQRVGFDYYVEVWDAAKNGPARIGSPEEPLPVPPAKEGTLKRLERERREAELGPVHPGWIMLAMGTGIVAGAASGWFWYDLFNTVQPNLAAIDAQLADNTLSSAERAALEKARAEFESSRTGDLIFGSILGVVGLTGLSTGVALLVVSAMGE